MQGWGLGFGVRVRGWGFGLGVGVGGWGWGLGLGKAWVCWGFLGRGPRACGEVVAQLMPSDQPRSPVEARRQLAASGPKP